MGLEFYANSGILQNVTQYFPSVCNIVLKLGRYLVKLKYLHGKCFRRG